MNTVKSNQKLTCRAIGDHNCIFELTVVERKGNFATINYEGKIKRVKVYTGADGDEYLRPDKYSMAPIFRAIN